MISTANCLRLRICMFRFNSFTYFNTHLQKTIMLLSRAPASSQCFSSSISSSVGPEVVAPDCDRLGCLSSASQRESSGQHSSSMSTKAALAFNQRNRAFEIWTVSSLLENFDTHATPAYFCSSSFCHLYRAPCCFVFHQSLLFALLSPFLSLLWLPPLLADSRAGRPSPPPFCRRIGPRDGMG